MSLRFGDFELDVRAGELRKNGVRLRVADQSLQILEMLVERPGEVVLREEIRERLWPDNTTVEFDHSINAAIKRLRNALGESAEEPRYIETLTKRGYRFSGEVLCDESPIRPSKNTPRWRHFRLAWIALAALAGVALVALAPSRLRETLPRHSRVRFQFSPPEGRLEAFRISPDGRFLGETVAQGSALRRVFVRSLDGLETRRLLDFTPGDLAWFWSWDGEFIAYQSAGKLYKISRSGGTPVYLADLPREPMAGAWLDNGVIVIGTATSLFKVPATGGALVKIVDQRAQRPVWLPGNRFLFTGPKGVFAGSVDGRKPVQILPDFVFPTYVASTQSASQGHILFVRAGTLFAQPFDADTLQFRGNSTAIADHVSENRVAASTNGVLAYAGDAPQEAVLTWLDRSGKKLGTAGKPFVPIPNEAIRLSPDESKALVPIMAAPRTELWMADFKRGTFLKFAFQPSQSGIWSPDGKKVLWATDYGGRYLKSADGSGEDGLYFQNPGGGDHMPGDWSTDGKFIVVSGPGSVQSALKLWLVPTAGDRNPVLYRQTGYTEYWAQISPDNRWMAYEGADTPPSPTAKNAPHIFIESIPTGRGRWQLPLEHINWPMWRRDGKELFFAQGAKLLSVPVRLGAAAIEIGNAQTLFELPQLQALFRFQVSRDGQRFLVALPPEQTAASQMITVDTDWRAARSK
jgi:DNA-binding winged helix-turn-helix (wHTH) protein/Tol biopolymer transport system component